MFQIANPIDKPVSFGEDGLPLAAREKKLASEISSGTLGHGLGSRSIRAFCEKLRRHL